MAHACIMPTGPISRGSHADNTPEMRLNPWLQASPRSCRPAARAPSPAPTAPATTAAASPSQPTPARQPHPPEPQEVVPPAWPQQRFLLPQSAWPRVPAVLPQVVGIPEQIVGLPGAAVPAGPLWQQGAASPVLSTPVRALPGCVVTYLVVRAVAPAVSGAPAKAPTPGGGAPTLLSSDTAPPVGGSPPQPGLSRMPLRKHVLLPACGLSTHWTLVSMISHDAQRVCRSRCFSRRTKASVVILRKH